MFNASRSPSNRYPSPLANGLLSSTASFASDPLVSSAYVDPDAGLDPWSSAPSPAPIMETAGAFNAVLGDAHIPALYIQTFNAIDATGSGSITLNALQRVLTASDLPTATVEKIVNIVSSRPRVSRMEFYVALALVGCAQRNMDVSIETISALAIDNNLPLPKLDPIAMKGVSTSTIRSTFPPPNIARPTPGYNAEADPWTNASRGNFTTTGNTSTAATILSSGLPNSWWTQQEEITITVHGQAGYIFNRYTLYNVKSFTRGRPVQRRYSEFILLWDGLVKRYPFRILVNLPPKRIGPDDHFIEQRRKGLMRFLNYVVNHPVLKEDGLLAAFLSEQDFDSWRKNSPISLEEESATKRLDATEEMSIPSDLEDKLAVTRKKIGMLIEQWTRLCTTAERILKRREAAAADLARVTLSIGALVEGTEGDTWGNPSSELASGVRAGLSDFSGLIGRFADAMDSRSRTALSANLEALKSQRDLYIAVRDLFFRHDRLATDNVDKLRKRVDTQSVKVESIKAAKKDGWQVEADKISVSIERDQAAIQAALARRVFIRWSIWHEFRVILHNRENTLISVLMQTWTADERDYAESVLQIWKSMAERAEEMPLE